MRILIISTIKRRVSSNIFASRSRIIYQLAKGLAQKGHEVSLLGTEDSSIPGVKVIAVTKKGWVDLPAVENPFVRDVGLLSLMLATLKKVQNEFDIIHNHTYPDFFPSIIEQELKIPLVTTLHAVLEPHLDETLSQFSKTHFIALSHAYKKNSIKTHMGNVVYNGVDTDLYSFSEKKDNYLFWLGRLPKGKKEDGSFIDPKGVRWAIKLARETGERLILAGAVEDPVFYDNDVKPYLSEKIQWLGDVSSEQSLPIEKVVSIMQHAKAFLMTINQDEPFGLVMAEAMSCGTPVIGFNIGAVPEIVENGKTGYVVDKERGVDGLREALANLKNIKFYDCRQRAIDHFSIEKMISSYEDIYDKTLSNI